MNDFSPEPNATRVNPAQPARPIHAARKKVLLIGAGILVAIVVIAGLWYWFSQMAARRAQNAVPAFSTGITDEERAAIMAELQGESGLADKQRAEAIKSVEGESTLSAEERAQISAELGAQ